MMDFALEHNVSTIIVENASRFSRDLIVAETGFAYLRDRGIELIAADDPDAFVADTPTAVMVRQILGAVSQFEKATTVDKLRAARDRASEAKGRRVEGRKGYAETAPELVREAKRLRRASPKTGKRRSYDRIALELAAQGFVTRHGKAFSAAQVRRLVVGD
jgi:DNA invertase Pin-like site-specific DNA recombinase